MNLQSSDISTQPDGTKVMTVVVVLPSTVTNARAYEQQTQELLNHAGLALMDYGLACFDTEGEPLNGGGRLFTSKGRSTETYQTVFGPVTLARYVYQHSGGGKTWCPLESRARIISLATPHMADLVAGALCEDSGRGVQQRFAEHHRRELSLGFIQQLTAESARIAEQKEAHWTYEMETPPESVHTIALGVDGTCTPTCQDGWKQAMVGTITLHDKAGEALESAYVANAPEDGKATFFERMRREIAVVRERYAQAQWVGISDGAKDLRPFLQEHAPKLILDFWHAAEYVCSAAKAMQRDEALAETWRSDALHHLKHEPGAAQALLAELELRLEDDSTDRLTAAERLTVTTAAGYIRNNIDRMDYAAAVAAKLPIGSGVTEAACKTVIKARVCGSGMRWHAESMQQILVLRALRKSSNRWSQFWDRIEREGY